MASSIYKYKLRVIHEQDIVMPKGATILHADEQDSELVLWANVKHGVGDELRRFRVIGTGEPIETFSLDGYEHVNTVLSSSRLVLHVFVRIKPVDEKDGS